MSLFLFQGGITATTVIRTVITTTTVIRTVITTTTVIPMAVITITTATTDTVDSAGEDTKGENLT